MIRTSRRCPNCARAWRGWMPELPTIPSALEFRRKEYGWTMKRMARELGIGATHYSEVVSGKRALPMAATVRAHSIGVPASVLLNPHNRRITE